MLVKCRLIFIYKKNFFQGMRKLDIYFRKFLRKMHFLLLQNVSFDYIHCCDIRIVTSYNGAWQVIALIL